LQPYLSFCLRSHFLPSLLHACLPTPSFLPPFNFLLCPPPRTPLSISSKSAVLDLTDESFDINVQVSWGKREGVVELGRGGHHHFPFRHNSSLILTVDRYR
jgi:hypothetical protein